MAQFTRCQVITERDYTTLLSRTWKSACLLCLVTNIIFQVAVVMDQKFSAKPVCTAGEFSSWMIFVKCIEAVIFFAKFINLMSHMISYYEYEEIFSIIVASSVVVLIAGTSSLLTIMMNWGGLCEDAFG